MRIFIIYLLILYSLQLQAMELKYGYYITWQTLKDLEEDNRIDIISELYHAINSHNLQINPNTCLRRWFQTPTTHDKALSEIFEMGLCDEYGVINKDTAEIIKSYLHDITCKKRYPFWYSLLHPIPWPLVKKLELLNSK